MKATTTTSDGTAAFQPPGLGGWKAAPPAASAFPARPALVALLAFAFAGCVAPVAPTTSAGRNPGVPWPATDALGRTLPTSTSAPSPAPAPRPDRTVGMFYFLWHERFLAEPAFNIARILAQDPDILTKPNSPLWGPARTQYYWGEPLYGYYNALDPWVVRRHATLLADAGIDTVIFDTTNRLTYRAVYLKICEVWAQVRREGGRTPQICFMVNTKAGETAQEIFRDLYQPGLHRDLWFHWQGKPLLLCDPKAASPEVAAFFTLRKAHWPFTQVNTHNAWHWENTHPQVYSYDTDPAKPEQVNVSVAQNLRASDGKVTNMSQGNGRGRSFHDGKQAPAPGDIDRGPNFAEQWRRALELDPPFVMVTGWNEWTAGKFSRPQQPVVFVDQFDQEFSRDIEPVTGLHGDNYYYQLVDGVRRYKGAPALPPATAARTIDLAADFAQWRSVGPEFTDHAFDTDHRDFGKGARYYVNTTGRNDLVAAKVAHDATHIFFYARTRQPLTPASDPNWMLLFLDTDQKRATGWEGYDFVINRSIDGRETWLERHAGGATWERVAKIPFTVSGHELMLAVPRAALGLPPGDALALDFKWWDNSQKPGEIMDAYMSGDAAPDGRFNYRYVAPAAPP
ncbi:MAG: hypothetical protein RLZZ15_619 [Verrucomicrobiota bacterium]|jgi:hypothetical protein